MTDKPQLTDFEEGKECYTYLHYWGKREHGACWCGDAYR